MRAIKHTGEAEKLFPQHERRINQLRAGSLHDLRLVRTGAE